MTNVERLYEKLNETGASIGGLTLGPKGNDPEAVAAEILKSIEAIERGEFEEIADIGI